MSKNKVYRFSADLKKFPGRAAWHYLEFPYNTMEEFGKKGQVRVKGTINGVPYQRSLLPRGNGKCFIVISVQMRKAMKLTLGDVAVVVMERDTAPQKIVVPEELLAVFDIDPEAKNIYDLQSTSIRKYICLWISEAKGAQTRADRAAEILRRLTTPGEMFGGTRIKRQ